MYSSENKIGHKYGIYPLLNTIVDFVKKSIIKKTNLPFISIFIFISVIILNSIQYSKNDTQYLQNTSTTHLQHKFGQVTLSNTLLYIYNLIGINGFLSNGLAHILFFMLTYFCLALIEMNIGHVALLFLLLVDIMFQFTIGRFKSSVCINYLSGCEDITNATYCCGSFVLFISLGFVLYLIYKNMNTKLHKGLILFVILCVWIGCILTDKYINFADNKEDDSIKICQSFLWNSANFLLGVFSGIVLSN